MPLTKKQKQLRASIAHARTFRHLDSAAESSRNSMPAGITTPSLRTEDLAHLTPPASPESDLNDGGIFLDVIEEESEQLLEDYGGNSLLGTIEAVTRDAESQDEDDVIELQGEELVESLRCQMEAEITLERQLSKEGLGMDAYRAGKNAKDAQLQVRKYGSCQYKSHHHAPMRDPTEG